MAAADRTPLVPRDEPGKPRDKTGTAPAVTKTARPGAKEPQKLPWMAIIGGLLVLSALLWMTYTYVNLPVEKEVKKSKKH